MSQGLLKREAWAFKPILRIFCKCSSVYLATGDSEKPIIVGLIVASLWLDFGQSEVLNRLLVIRSLQERFQPWIEIILVIKVERSRVNPKQCYTNGLADLLGIKQLEF